MIKDKYCTLTRAGELLGKDRRTIARWMKTGKLQGEHIGGVVLVEIAELERLRPTLSPRGRKPPKKYE